MTKTIFRIVLGLTLCAAAAPGLSAMQTINGVTCDRAACARPLELVNGESVTISLSGQGLAGLVSGVVTDRSGRPIQGVSVALGDLPSAIRTRSLTTTRDVTLTAQGVGALSDLQLRFTTSRRGSVTAPLDLSVAPVTSVAMPVAPRDPSVLPSRDPNRTLTTVAEALPPRISSASPSTIILGPRESGSVEIAGSNLDELSGAYVADENGRLVYHVRAELEPGDATRRTVRLAVPDNPNQRGPFGTPMTIMVTGEPGSSTPTPARVEVRPTYDLYISSCSIEPLLYAYGDYRGVVTVINHGINTIAASLPGRSTLVQFNTHLNQGGHKVILVPDGGLYLAPGQAWSYKIGSMTFSPDPEPATQSFRLLPRDDERSHANNERTCRVPPHPGSPPPATNPDLIVQQVAVTPASGPPSTEFVVTVTVKNQGEDALVIPSSVRCTIPDERGYVPSLEAGESQSFTFPVTHSLVPGQQETTCTVDPPPGKVTESDEDNNSRSASFVVTPPDDH